MRTREDIESYLMRAGLPYRELEPDMWMIHDSGAGENIVLRLTGPLILFRLKVFELAQAKDKEQLYQRLLEFNAADMVHGSYGIADNAVVITCALRLENLDYNEFQGTIDDFSMAITNHYAALAMFRSAAS